ncbi:autotransporter domain-containing protein [Phycisphaerales bacterium AB-hyl4]|uniref:Autotransporter domain-containing protein n=1 Tax=Natronomicrosphaera hydrolytica TaxID=3242702 RepID=A0ABV4U7Q4_9BACT
MAQDTQWDAGTGDWFDDANWSNNEPTASSSVTIDNDGTANIQSGGATAQYIYVGDTDGNSGFIRITGGGELTTSDDGSNWTSVLGRFSNSTGEITVDGDGSVWNNLGNTHVGSNGSGTLTISDGGLVITGNNFLLGQYPGSTGILNIGDGGAAGILDTASVHGGSSFGSGGPAILNFNHTDSDYWFTSDGTADGDAISITGSTEVNTLGSGWTTLTGTHDYAGGTQLYDDSTLRIHDADLTTRRFFVGVDDGDNAVLRIEDGSTVVSGQGNIAADYSVIGVYADSVGTVIVDGADTSWISPADLFVGENGMGTLYVTGGATVESGYAFVSGGNHSTGQAVIHGEDSTWTVNEDLYVGSYGSNADGQMMIANGGVVNVAGDFILADNSTSWGTLTIGDDGAAGILNADRIEQGSGIATLRFHHTDSDYWFTNDGTGDGETIQLAGRVMIEHNQTGTTTLTGQVTDQYTGRIDVNRGTLRFDNATFESTEALRANVDVGDITTMELINGSHVTVSSTELGAAADADSTLIVAGENTTLTTDWMYPGWEGNYTIFVEDGGTIDVVNDIWSTGGQITVDGEGSRLAADAWYIGWEADHDDTLTVTNGGKLIGRTSFELANGVDAYATLNIGDGGAAGIIDTETITTGDGTATVNFNHTDSDYRFTRDGTADGDDVIIAGSTSVNHHNTGTTTLFGTHTYTGDTRVSAGTLVVNGSIADSDFEVTGSGTLGGTGTVGNLLLSQGTLRPGNSIGTLTVDGDYIHTSNATLEIEINDGGNQPGVNNDLVEVTGDATLQGGTVSVLAEPGNYKDGTQYTFLHADGSVVSTYDQITVNLAHLFTAELGYTHHTAYFTLLLNDTEYESLGLSGDQRGVGKVLDDLFPTATGDLAVLFNELAGLDDNDARNAIQQLSGETTGASSTAVVQATTGARNTVFNRMRPAVGSLALPGPATSFDGGSLSLASADTQQSARLLADMRDQRQWLAWVQGYGEYGDVDGSNTTTGFDYWTGGAMAGVDRSLNDNWLVGLYGGYARSRVSSDGGRQKMNIDHYLLGLHTRYDRDRWYGLASVFTGYQRYDNERNLRFGGIDRQADATFSGGQIGSAVELGRTYEKSNWTIQPLAGVQYVFVHREAYTESGADAANLELGHDDTHSLQSSLGVNLARALFDHGDTHAQLHLRARYNYEFLDDGGTVSARFAGSGGDAFSVDSAELGRHSGQLGAGIGWQMNERTNLHVGYDVQFNDRYHAHHGMATLSFAW